MSLLERLGFKKRHKKPHAAQKKDVDKIVFSCRYTTGGGMEGGHEWYDLVKHESGLRKLSYSYQKANGTEEIDGEMEPGEDLVERILELYEKAGVESFGKLEKSEFIALDAPTESVYFLVDGKETKISDSDVIPERGKGIIGKVYTTFQGYVFKRAIHHA